MNHGILMMLLTVTSTNRQTLVPKLVRLVT
jgi:hypothetical protein